MSKIQTKENKLMSRASEPGAVNVLVIVNNSSVTIHAMTKLRADTNTIYGEAVCYANSSSSFNDSTVAQDRIVNVFTETGNKIINATLTLNNTVLNQWSDLEISDVFEGITIDTTKTYTLTISSVTNPPEYHSKFILKSFTKCPKQLVIKYSDPEGYSMSALPKKIEVLADNYYTSVLLPTLASSNPNYITFNCWAVVSTSTPVSTSTQIKENNVNLKAVWIIKNGILYIYNNLSDSVNVYAYDSGSYTIDSRSVMYNSSDSMLLGDGNYYKCTMLNVQTGYQPTFMLTLQDSSGNVVDTQYVDSYSGYIYNFNNYSPYHDHMTLWIDYIAESESESYDESESESGTSSEYIVIYNNTNNSMYIEAYNTWGTMIESVNVYPWSSAGILQSGNFNDCYYINVVNGSYDVITVVLMDNSYYTIESQSGTSTLTFNGINSLIYYSMPLQLHINASGESESESGESESGGDNIVVYNNSPYTIYISVDSSSSYDVYSYSDALITQASNYYLIDPGGYSVTVITEDSYGNVMDNRAVTTYDYFYDYYKSIKTIRIYGNESESESESGYESEIESGGDFDYDTILVSQVEVLSTDTFQLLFDAASLNDTVNIDWGDGTIETFHISDCMYTVDGDCYKVTLSHMYSQTGTYTITHSYNCYAPYDTTDNVDVIGTRVYMWPREAYRVVSFDIQKSADHRKINPSFLKNEGTSSGTYSGNPSLQYVNFGTGVTHVTSNGLNSCSNLETLLMPGITDATSDFDIYDSPIKTLDIGYKSSIQSMLYTFDEGTIETLYLRSTSVVSVHSDEVEYLPSDLTNIQTIYVPAELLSAYQNDSVWGQFFSKFAPIGGESESESESDSASIEEFIVYFTNSSSDMDKVTITFDGCNVLSNTYQEYHLSNTPTQMTITAISSSTTISRVRTDTGINSMVMMSYYTMVQGFQNGMNITIEFSASGKPK